MRFITLIFLLLPGVLSAASGMTGHLVPHRAILGATVVSVESGDILSITINDRGPIKVHLDGISAPHLEQPFGKRAKDELSKRALGKSADVHVSAVTSQTEIVATVFCQAARPDVKTNVNIEMVQEGWAWYDVRSGVVKPDPNPPSYRNMTLVDFQSEARKAHRGLWADKSPIAPWEWRTKKVDVK